MLNATVAGFDRNDAHAAETRLEHLNRVENLLEELRLVGERGFGVLRKIRQAIHIDRAVDFLKGLIGFVGDTPRVEEPFEIALDRRFENADRLRAGKRSFRLRFRLAVD